MKPDTNWKPYPNGRKILEKEGYFVIVPFSYGASKSMNMPIFCDVCECRFHNKEDEVTYNRFGCCSPCADQWAYSNKEKWLNGWRPSKEQVSKFVEKRNFSESNIRFL